MQKEGENIRNEDRAIVAINIWATVINKCSPLGLFKIVWKSKEQFKILSNEIHMCKDVIHRQLSHRVRG